jgi:hypothetical protein
MADYIKACPHCKANLVGDPIPEATRELFGNKTHFHRIIAVVDRDRCIHYQCPDCEKVIPNEQAFE